ncbi:MAG: hypothetical protein HY846_00345 [Nitrosomonadales bacterium]|nr:hypothetical protein [Nitrosomonadales bacterium]
MLLCLTGWLAPQLGLADIDPAEYGLKSSVRSEKERQRLQAEFHTDKKREAELQRQEEEIEARRLAAEKAAWDALPYPVRLTKSRCTTCHIADYYTRQRHNRIGWGLVNLRMQYWNGVALTAEERVAIADYLAESYPAAGAAAMLEALLQLAVPLLPLWLWLAWKITRSRFGKRLNE